MEVSPEFRVIVDLLIAYAWPIVLLVLVSLFKDDLRTLIRNIESLRYKDLSLSLWGQAPSDSSNTAEEEAAKQEIEAEEEEPPGEKGEGPERHWDKAASLFWLGNDLMWTQDMLYRGAPPERVMQGLLHVREYASRLGLLEKGIKNELDPTISIAEALLGVTIPSVLEGHYRSIAKSVNTIKWIVSAFAEQEEPGFAKLR
jgi:hypothetical protein